MATTLTLHWYTDKKQPYAAKIIAADNGKTKLDFLPKHLSSKNKNGSSGDFQVTIEQPGLYQIGNAQDDANGFRLYFKTSSGAIKFPFERNLEIVEEIKRRIAGNQPIETIITELEYDK